MDSNGDRESAYMMKHVEASGAFKVGFLRKSYTLIVG